MNCQDEARVNMRFQQASSKGICIESTFFEFDDLLVHLEQNGLAIVLTDANFLDCQTCKSFVRGLGCFVRTIFQTKLPFSGME